MELGTIISTRGYRGLITGGEFVQPGEHMVSNALSVHDGTVTAAQAEYMVVIGMAQVVSAPDGMADDTVAEVYFAPAALADKTLVELQDQARAWGVLFTGKRKAELIDVLTDYIKERA